VADITIEASPFDPSNPDPNNPSSSSSSSSDEDRKSAAGGMIAVGVIFIIVVVAAIVGADVFIVFALLRLFCMSKLGFLRDVVKIVKDVAIVNSKPDQSKLLLIPPVAMIGLRALQAVVAFITMIVASVGSDELRKLSDDGWGSFCSSTPTADDPIQCQSIALKWSHDMIITVSVFCILIPIALMPLQIVPMFLLHKVENPLYNRIIKIVIGVLAGPCTLVVELLGIFLLVIAVAAAGQAGALMESGGGVASAIFAAILLLTLAITQCASLAFTIGFILQMLPNQGDDEDGDGENDEKAPAPAKGVVKAVEADGTIVGNATTTVVAEAVPLPAGDFVTATFDYAPDGEGTEPELAFKTGDVITVLARDDEGWWEGELNGKRGLFPANYTSGIP
jgi:hypothetical protein